MATKQRKRYLSTKAPQHTSLSLPDLDNSVNGNGGGGVGGRGRVTTSSNKSDDHRKYYIM